MLLPADMLFALQWD